MTRLLAEETTPLLLVEETTPLPQEHADELTPAPSLDPHPLPPPLLGEEPILIPTPLHPGPPALGPTHALLLPEEGGHLPTLVPLPLHLEDGGDHLVPLRLLEGEGDMTVEVEVGVGVGVRGVELLSLR